MADAPLKVLGVITARGGSRGVPRKNVRILGGKPLIAWTIEAARASRGLARTVVSTEDAEIAEVARASGAWVPFLRPAEMSTDAAGSLPALQHALRETERLAGETWDYVLTLQPTSPFRTAADIDAIIDLARAARPESLLGVVKVEGDHPCKCRRIENGVLVDYWPEHPEPEGTPRQAFPPAWRRNGALFMTRRDILLGGSLYGRQTVPYPMPAERSVDINTPLDWEFAEFMMARGAAGAPPA
jgi:CMP-N-acetylneuraminic acid synthetase